MLIHFFDSNQCCAYCGVHRNNVIHRECVARSNAVLASDLTKEPTVHQPTQEEQAAFNEEVARHKAMNRPDSAPLRPSARDILSKARDIQEQRAKDYDQPEGERSMGATVDAFNIITRRAGQLALSESEGWLLLQILKDVRDRSTPKPHEDSLMDGVSYSALKAEARFREVSNECPHKNEWTGIRNFGGAVQPPPRKL